MCTAFGIYLFQVRVQVWCWKRIQNTYVAALENTLAYQNKNFHLEVADIK
jgi:hypothetical protein